MNKIISKEHFSEKVFKLVIEAPLIAKSRKAGHFVIVRVGEKGERMPLTIAAADPVKGTITLVVQEVGLSSTRLCELNEGDYITDVVGPLGQATHIENFGTVVCAGGGVGVAPMLPIVQALKAAGNRVITVLAGRTKELIILEKEMRESSDEVIIMTDDGSYGRKGLVTEGVEDVIKREKVDKCFCIGPAIMMKFVCLLTKKYEIPTDVSLNTIMVDGTGMCGACRITIGGKTKFVCVDGPEFDGHQVDFDEMLKRMGAFKNIEREEMHKLEEPSRTAQVHESQRAYCHSPRGNERVGCGIPFAQPQGRSEPGIDRGTGPDRSQTLFGLRQSGVHGGLPRRYRHTPFHQEYRTRRVSGSSQNIERNQRIARCLRSCVSAGKTMRIQVYPFEDERKAGCHRLSGTLRRRLRAGKRTNLRAGNQRKERH